MKLKILLVLSFSTALLACSNESNTNDQSQMLPINQQDLQKNWQLIQLDSHPVKTNSNLKIDELAKASGNLSCNNFLGTLELQENKLRINKIVSTRKMCAPEMNKIEMTVSSTLSTWSKIKVSEQKLTLTGERHTLVYHVQ
jgi:heat shock protein HslJ